MSDLSEAIPIAETFYSIQGEGPTMGVPSVFLRVSHCNLRCPAWGPPGSPQGCDTTDVWSKVWRRMTPEHLIEYWEQVQYAEALRRGAHLILTGGEPMLWQPRLAALLQLLFERVVRLVRVEVETNATIMPQQGFASLVGQWNCSPKLESAGNALEKAYVPNVLRYFADDPRAIFKFVVQETWDLLEIFDKYVHEFDIARSRVWLMPEAATQERLLERSGKVAEQAKEYGFNFSSRLQLVIYDRAVGV